MRRRAGALIPALALLILAASAPSALAQATAPGGPPATAAASPARPPVHGFEIVRTYPHDRTAFTQGLVWRNGELLETTGKEPPTIRRVTLVDGAARITRPLDGTFPEGLTVLGDRAFSLTWTGGRGFIWNPDTLEPLGEFAYAGEGWGLTNDGTRLILSDGSDRLRFFDPATLAETGAVQVTFMGQPVNQLNELEFIDGEVWANVWMTDVILRIDPATGAVRSVVNLAGLMPDRTGLDPADDVLNGIAWDPDGRRLFVTGKRWPSLFEIRVTEPN